MRLRSWRAAAGLIGIIALATGCTNEPNTSGNPSDGIEIRPSSERVAMDELFAGFDNDTPGCAVAVRFDDGTSLDAQYGMADLDGDPITADTVFDIGSVSKQMTAGAVALLIVNGDLTLDDDIVDHVPELGPFPETITIGDLVHHTSGLPDYIDFLDAEDDEITTMVDALDVIASADGEPVVEPGIEFGYSNTNYVLLVPPSWNEPRA